MSLTPNCRTASTTALTTAGSGCDRAGLTDALGSERVRRRRRRRVVGVEADRVGSGRHQVVDERRRDEGAGIVVHGLLEQRLGDALDETAVDLTGDDHRVDDVADVVAAGVLAHRHLSGLGVDLHRTQVSAVRVAEGVRVERRVRVERGLHAVGQVVRGEHGGGELGDPHALVGALDREAAATELEVVGRGLHEVGGDRLRLLDHLVDGSDHRLAADDEGSGAVGVEALRGHLSVTVQHLDVLERHTKPVGDDLAEGRLVALAVGGRPGDHLDLAGAGQPDRGVLPAARTVVERADQLRRRPVRTSR